MENEKMKTNTNQLKTRVVMSTFRQGTRAAEAPRGVAAPLAAVVTAVAVVVAAVTTWTSRVVSFGGEDRSDAPRVARGRP